MHKHEIIGRSRPRWRRAAPTVVFAVTLVAGISIAAVPAMASPARSVSHDAAGSSGAVVSVSHDATLKYWTPARIKAAIPVSVISAGKAAPRKATQKPVGAPGRSPGHAPTGARSASRASASKGTNVANCSAGSCPYDSFEVTPAPTKKGGGVWQDYPYDVNGALFFENDGSDYSCSGTAIGSSHGSSDENEIWTAGHCLINTESLTGVRDSSAIFVPAYNGNAPITYVSTKKEEKWAPFGVFTWDGAWESSTAWINNRDLTEDESAMQFDTSDITGETLGQAVGWAGFTWNDSVNEQFIAFGYPAGSPYNGADLEEDIGTTGGQDSNGGADSTNPIYIGSPFTGGSSGGAWTIGWSDSGTGYVNGHNDYIYTNQTDTMYSPYQDTLSNDVRCFGATSC